MVSTSQPSPVQTMQDSIDKYLIDLVTWHLEERVSASISDVAGCQELSFPKFNGSPLPMTMEAFISRIVRYGCKTPCCYVSALIFLDRLRQQFPNFRITPFNCQRFILLSVVISTKFFDDIYFSNKVWAKIGGVSVQELNALELEFLFSLRFQLFIHGEEYNSCVANLYSRYGRAGPPLSLLATAVSLEALDLTSVSHALSLEPQPWGVVPGADNFAEDSELSRGSTPCMSREDLRVPLKPSNFAPWTILGSGLVDLKPQHHQRRSAHLDQPAAASGPILVPHARSAHQRLSPSVIPAEPRHYPSSVCGQPSLPSEPPTTGGSAVCWRMRSEDSFSVGLPPQHCPGPNWARTAVGHGDWGPAAAPHTLPVGASETGRVGRYIV